MFGLRDRIKSKADIAATRAWMQSFDPEDYESLYSISRAEIPKSLRGLGRGVRFSADENGNPRVRFGWGSAVMGYWGAVIGMKDMEIPPSDFSLYGEYRLPVEPGVYVFEVIQ
jgi:hypothetical protein